jgi:hypothetical protein
MKCGKIHCCECTKGSFWHKIETTLCVALAGPVRDLFFALHESRDMRAIQCRVDKMRKVFELLLKLEGFCAHEFEWNSWASIRR